MSDLPLDESGRTKVNLVRSSQPWTEADSAAGFVLRYLTPMRRSLTAALGSTSEADRALKLFLGHLVSVGFGEHRQGRLRDFLIKGIRSAAKNRINEMPPEQRNRVRLDEVTADSKAWITLWREGLLERAWRSLERQEHAHPDTPVYSLLHSATRNPQATPEMLAAQLATDENISLDPQQVPGLLASARAVFAQLIADEVAETLDDPNEESVKQEIARLGLGKAFTGVGVTAKG